MRFRIATDELAYYIARMESFAYEVADTARAMRRDFDRRAAALGVTRSQWRVLARLGRSDGARQVDLADALDIEPITLARLVDRLADAGLVERRPDKSDRRAWNVYLTPRSAPVIARLQALGAEFHADALEGVSEAEKEAARRVLARVRQNLSERAAAVRRAS
jgi:MarR family transcriptional regulator for hemolysin